jgi:hypothetical protein
VFGWFNPPPTHPPNSEALPTLSQILSPVEYTPVTTYSEYGFHSFANWVEPLARGLPPPNPHSLSSILNIPAKKNSWIRHCVAVYFGRWAPTFRRSLSPPFSAYRYVSVILQTVNYKQGRHTHATAPLSPAERCKVLQAFIFFVL